jgi:hypothetical protein
VLEKRSHLYIGCCMHAIDRTRFVEPIVKKGTLKVNFDSVWARKNKTGCMEQGSEHLVGEFELTDSDLETVCGGGGGSQSSSPCSSSSYPGQGTPPDQGTPAPAGNSNPWPSGNRNDYPHGGCNSGNSSDGGYNTLMPSGFQIVVNVTPDSTCPSSSY